MLTPLISAQALAARPRGSTLVFDCRNNLQDEHYGEQAHRQGHLPGAIHLDLKRHLSGPVKQHGGRHPLPDPQRFSQLLRQSGVTPLSQIVVYDDQHFAFAARAWWLMQYLGLPDVQLLDGGYQAWLDADLPVDRRMPTPQAGQFRPTVNYPWVLDYHQVCEIIDDEQYTLIDARDAKRYRGEEEPIDPIAGHIPGALNFPWQAVTDAQGFAQPESFHQQHWQRLPPGSKPVVYCGSGVTACVDILSLVLSGRYRLDDIYLYAGSWSDWCSYDTPIRRSH